MRSKLYIDFHVIQTVPPSNINRDDTGSPKTAQYGGVRRARVSSQSWKKAMRDYFCDNSEQSNVGCRTLSIVSYIAKKIRELDNSVNEDESLKLANEVLKIAKIQTKDNKTKALFFLGDLQANSLARAALDKITDKEKIKELFRDNPAIDIALFGRMVADDPSLNEDASSQVAHAISTHAIESEFDFYTAIDDLSPEDNAGAGMLGTVEFNSSTLYRYANVAVHELQRQLDCKEATISTLKLFVEAFVKSLPTGKINSFANQTLPHTLVVTLREDRPVNMVSAFEKPVKSNEGYVLASEKKLAEEFGKSIKFIKKPISSIYLTLNDNNYNEFGEKKESFDELTSYLSEKLNELIDTCVGE